MDYVCYVWFISFVSLLCVILSAYCIWEISSDFANPFCDFLVFENIFWCFICVLIYLLISFFFVFVWFLYKFWFLFCFPNSFSFGVPISSISSPARPGMRRTHSAPLPWAAWRIFGPEWRASNGEQRAHFCSQMARSRGAQSLRMLQTVFVSFWFALHALCTCLSNVNSRINSRTFWCILPSRFVWRTNLVRGQSWCMLLSCCVSQELYSWGATLKYKLGAFCPDPGRILPRPRTIWRTCSPKCHTQNPGRAGAISVLNGARSWRMALALGAHAPYN